MSTFASLSRLTLLGAFVACLVGVLTLTGWIFGLDELKSIVPGTITMKPNTAIAFIALGGALFLADRRASLPGGWIADALATAAMSLAAIVGLQYVIGVDLGVDQLLFREPAGAVGTVDPGRMSPQTSIAFVLLGCAFLLARRDLAPRARTILTLVPAGLGVLNLLDAILGATTPSFLASFTQMALPTATAFSIGEHRTPRHRQGPVATRAVHGQR